MSHCAPLIPIPEPGRTRLTFPDCSEHKEAEKRRNVLGREGHFQPEIPARAPCAGLPLAENVPAVSGDKPKAPKSTNILLLAAGRSRRGWKGWDRRVYKACTGRVCSIAGSGGAEGSVSSGNTANTTIASL